MRDARSFAGHVVFDLLASVDESHLLQAHTEFSFDAVLDFAHHCACADNYRVRLISTTHEYLEATTHGFIWELSSVLESGESLEAPPSQEQKHLQGICFEDSGIILFGRLSWSEGVPCTEYLIPACVWSGRWADLGSCSCVGACAFRRFGRE